MKTNNKDVKGLVIMNANQKEYERNEELFNKLDRRDKETAGDSYHLKQIHLLMLLQLDELRKERTTIISNDRVGLNNGINSEEKLVIKGGDFNSYITPKTKLHIKGTKTTKKKVNVKTKNTK